jgi:hypothetical protein
MTILAFSMEAQELLGSIISRVSIQQSEAFCKVYGLESTPVDTFGLWDTGANRSCISAKLARQLALTSIRTGETIGANGIFASNMYLLDILLPNKVSVHNVKVTEFIDSDDFDIIIGMDLITLGDFAISNCDRKTVVSFRIPSKKPPIDFRED